MAIDKNTTVAELIEMSKQKENDYLRRQERIAEIDTKIQELQKERTELKRLDDRCTGWASELSYYIQSQLEKEAK